MKAAVHLHTRYSWDSAVSPAALVDRLVGLRFDLALVADHDTFDGSLETARFASERGSALQVPLAAEIRTDRGDIIVILDDADPPPPVSALKKWPAMVEVVRSRGGLLWLPHPYRGHGALEDLAAEVDVIEVFNARCNEHQNAWARELCRRHGKAAAFASDAHLLREVGRFDVEYERHASLLGTLQQSPSCSQPTASQRSEVAVAEMINGVKRRRPGLLAYFALRYVVDRMRERLA